jgi:peptidoglycan hydrolase-like protein with peptidoglycan-binding domain
MDSKSLSDSGWKSVAVKFKIKDNGLQRALAAYSKLDEEDHEQRLKAIASVNQLASSLQRNKEVLAASAVSKYLDDLLTAAEAEERDITKAQAQANKEKAESRKRKGDENAKRADEEEEEQEEEGTEDYSAQLTEALRKLKGAKDVSFQFLVCDAKPHWGVMVAKRITAKHKQQLTQLTGSKRFLHLGECRFEDGHFVFSSAKPVSGMARRLQESLKHHTGKRHPIVVGTETADGDDEAARETPAGAEQPGTKTEEPPTGMTRPFEISASVGRGGKNHPDDVKAVQAALNVRAKAGLKVDGVCGPKTTAAILGFQKTLAPLKADGLIEPGKRTAQALAGGAPGGEPTPPQPVPPPQLGKPTLATAPEVWYGSRSILQTNIGEFKKAVRPEYGGVHPDLLNAIEKGMTKLDNVLEKLDTKLADCLAKAHAAPDDNARKAELKKGKAILTDYILYVKAEPLIAKIDTNPFGVQTNLKKILTDSLTHMARSIG